MPDLPQLSSDLRAGSRALDLIPGFESLAAFSWYKAFWTMPCRLRADVLEGGIVPSVTDWHLCVSDAYPAGPIELYPAKDRGLTSTFPHQLFNEDTPHPWRSGKLCLTADVLSLGRFGGGFEPGNARERLAWHVWRAFDWLLLASRGKLLPSGSDFELPHYPSPDGSVRLAFNESPDSLKVWKERKADCGLVTLVKSPGNSRTVIVTSFSDLAGHHVHKPSWGRGLEAARPGPRAAWIYLERPVVLEPWQAPVTWKELREHLHSQGVDLWSTFRWLAPHLRGPGRSILLLGFPIPRRVDDSPARVHWLAIELPVLPPPSARKGRHEHGLWERDFQILAAKPRLRWLPTESWDKEELGGRGRLPERLRERRTALLGVGALGSVIAEMLVRGGLRELSLLDRDSLMAGNLVRHLLTIDDLDRPKAESLAARLNRVSPHADVAASSLRFPEIDPAIKERFDAAELILDCTASDDVLLHLEREPGPLRTFVVLCLGHEARRLYAFTARGCSLPRAAYATAIRPWLERERVDAADQPPTREGIGCWNPVFPARIDAIWLLASVAVQYLAEVVSRPSDAPKLTVFERMVEGDVMGGVRRIDPDERDER